MTVAIKGQPLVKPNDCLCGFPEVTFENFTGHDTWCPSYKQQMSSMTTAFPVYVDFDVRVRPSTRGERLSPWQIFKIIFVPSHEDTRDALLAKVVAIALVAFAAGLLFDLGLSLLRGHS